MGTALAVIPLFAAFEAHVVNVTATIENALSVDTTPITFGTMFPEQVANQPLTVALSSSFLGSGNITANEVDYVIKQKPKCGLPEPSTNPVKYSAFEQVTENTDGIFSCPDTGYVVLPLLCPYLSKTSSNPKDTSIPAYHGPTSTVAWTDVVSTEFEAIGTLLKSTATSTNWTIDLHAPCFAGQCSQDNVVPVAYQMDPNNNDQLLGCDLWVEVTNVTSTP